MVQKSASTVVPVILSGGSGSRLWPKSRKAFPKQLHKLYGDHTMLQHTYNRVSHLEAPIVVCNAAQRFMVADQLSEVCWIDPHIILEPVGRNTAPAIAVAALQALKQSEKAILVVLPADHQIKDKNAFQFALDEAVEKASEGKLVAFGIVPTQPETGYGYINADAKTDSGAAINSFVEKPNKETAEQYLESGEYFWNSGMFVFSAKTFLEELEKDEPEMIAHCKASLESAQTDLDFIRLSQEAFEQNKDISIDYAVMEKTDAAWCVPLDCGWSDLGSWQSLWESSEKDAKGNATEGDVFAINCENTLLHSDKKLITGIGLKDIAVIDSDDATLVVNLNQTQDVKKVVDWLKENNRSEFELHREVHRPWGSYDSIDEGERYQVKRIEVKPGSSLSLQMHHHRAEHWVVVTGTALVQRGDEELILSENQSVYIPLGEKHRLTNPGKVPLQLVEVQSGSYLGEDDIVRFEDNFGRS
ncbi:MAG: mannose-1-phosphate guanylyltransferase/mannose-6-phosphate isomerase [Agarilytica sp.]